MNISETNEKPFIIRLAEEKNIPLLAEIFKNDLGYSDCTEETVRSQFAKLNPERETVFIASLSNSNSENESAAVGVIHVELYNTLYFPTLANLLALAVNSEYRKTGIVTALLKAAEKWAVLHGSSYMRLNSGIDRVNAHRFYQNRGYNIGKDQKRLMKKL